MLSSIRVRAEPTGALIGLEHEFRVLDGTRVVDFREIIHSLPIEGQRLDPGDTNAYRCRSGISITADGAEAEFATPPIDVRPGFARDLAAWAERGRTEIERTLPAGLNLEGFSTHLSITMDDAINEPVCALFAETFSPGFAMLIEGPRSQGIYVRPRPGRIELCGEFATGATLEAAATFAVGAVSACAASVRHASLEPLPPRLAVATLPGIERHGIRVRRESYGIDLYARGRAAALTLAGGGEMRAQTHLEAEWRVARASLRGRAATSDLKRVDGIVCSRSPLGIERTELDAEQPRTAPAVPAPRSAPIFGRREPVGSPFGSAVARVVRPGFTVTPRVLTWELAVLQIEGARDAYAAIPRSALAEFERRLARGRLDREIGAALARPVVGRVLRSRAQAAQPALFDAVGDTSALVAPERDPAGVGHAPAAGARAAKAGRAGKQAVAAAPVRAGKTASRRWKVMPIPVRVPMPVPVPVPIPAPASGGSGADVPPSGVEAGPPALPPEGVPLPAPPATWVTAAAVAAVGVIALAGAIGVFAVVHKSGDSHGGGSATTTPTHAVGAPVDSTPSDATKTPEGLTPAAAADGTKAPSPTLAAAAATAVASPSARPSDTASAAVATPTSPIDATATLTATPTPTRTPRPTETPRPTATFTPTPTPTATPTMIIIALPPTPVPTAVPTAVCTPSPGAVCP